jgi:formate dehydrogenase major subunit
MQRLGMDQPDYTPEGVLAEIAQIVPFFAGATWENLTEQGTQWPIAEGGIGTPILHLDSFKRGLGKFHFFEFRESKEIEKHGAEYPFVLTTGRILEHYNCGTMTRRTGNAEIVTRDELAINPEDAAKKNIQTGDQVKLFSARGEVTLPARVTDEVKPGIIYTTFHFPENMVNNVTGPGCDADTLCPEYKVIAADVELAHGKSKLSRAAKESVGSV